MHSAALNVEKGTKIKNKHIHKWLTSMMSCT